MYTQRNHRKEGGVLLLVVLVVLVMTVLGGGLLKLAQNNALEASAVQGRTRAFWLAEAGISEFRGIVAEWENRTPLANLNLVGAAVISGNITGSGSYSVDISNYTGGGWNNAGRSVKRYLIRSTGTTAAGVSATVEIEARTATFANYIFATHDERNIRFTTGDMITGDVHSNDEFTINGVPVFEGEVTTSSSTIDYTDSRSDTYVDPDVFTEGVERGVPELDFGQYGSDPIENLQSRADLLLTGAYDIEFIGNAYRYQTHDASPAAWTTNTIAANDIIYVTGNAYVEGRVGGAIAVVSEETVHITDDIVYNSSPANNYADWPDDFVPDGRELLGLLSKESIQVDSHGSGNDINIHAAIFISRADDTVDTGNPGFGTEDRYSNIGAPNINLLGSISQYTRGVVGTTRGAGFLKNYGYDVRFRDTPPPGIPYSAYLFSSWRQP